MSSISLGEQTTQGYEPPLNTQFSVFLDNRCGKLLTLVEVFEGHALDIAGLSVVDSADHAVVRLVTSRSGLAKRLLQRHDMPFSEAGVLVVELDEQHNLTKLCVSLLSAELNINYAYPLLFSPRGAPAVVLHTDDQFLAGQILIRKLFTLLGENDLGDNATPGSMEDESLN